MSSLSSQKLIYQILSVLCVALRYPFFISCLTVAGNDFTTAG